MDVETGVEQTESGRAREFSAPGRVNLIGEHTDYTGGLVLPMAIEFETVARVEARGDRIVSFSSTSFDGVAEYSLRAFPEHGRRHWSDYPAGVVKMLRDAGVEVSGFRMQLSGDVPLGAGLSSSASIEVATAVAVLAEAGTMLPAAEIATLCQRAENEYVGGACGIMDQFVITSGQKGHALLLDCRSLEFELLPLPESIRVVICNSMVKHEVAHGEYGDRRVEVEEGQGGDSAGATGGGVASGRDDGRSGGSARGDVGGGVSAVPARDNGECAGAGGEAGIGGGRHGSVWGADVCRACEFSG